MINNNENIYFVGVLQDLGMPYASLYVDKESRQLYLFVRVSENGNMDYFAANVSTHEVESYMNEDLGLVKIFNSRPVWYATINDNDEIYLNKFLDKDFIPNDKMKKMDIFNPELCDDDVWLETFLARINNNQPIEIA